MIGIKHAIVICFGMLGLFIGGILIDLDHGGDWKCKWKSFWKKDYSCVVLRGFSHEPVVMLSSALFFLGLGISIMIHYMMDYIIIE